MIWYFSGIFMFLLGFSLIIIVTWIMLEDGEVAQALLTASAIGAAFCGLSSLCFFNAGIYANYESFLGIITIMSNGIFLISITIFIVAAISIGIKSNIDNPIVSKVVTAIGTFIFVKAPAKYILNYYIPEEFYSNLAVYEKVWAALSILAGMLGFILG